METKPAVSKADLETAWSKPTPGGRKPPGITGRVIIASPSHGRCFSSGTLRPCPSCRLSAFWRHEARALHLSFALFLAFVPIGISDLIAHAGAAL